MPYKFETDKKKIPKYKDKRIKLTDKDKEEIKQYYGKISQRKLANFYGVSRRLIIFVACPEKHKKNLQDRKNRGGSKQYYNKEKQREYMKRYRKYKQQLNKNKELI
jgi:hypothetical protein